MKARTPPPPSLHFALCSPFVVCGQVREIVDVARKEEEGKREERQANRAAQRGSSGGSSGGGGSGGGGSRIRGEKGVLFFALHVTLFLSRLLASVLTLLSPRHTSLVLNELILHSDFLFRPCTAVAVQWSRLGEKSCPLRLPYPSA